MREARDLGVSWKMLQSARFTSLARGVYVQAPDESLATVVAGHRRTLPAASLATGVTGLQLYGVAVGPPRPLHLVTTHPRQVRRRGVRVTRVAELPAGRGTVAIPEHCWTAAALELSLLDLVTAGDWLIRLGHLSLEELTHHVRTTSCRGSRRARAAVGLVRERVDSPRETWLRLCLVLAGLPDPRCNVELGDRRGPIGRADLVFRAYRVLVEYDGDQHRSTRVQWNRDIQRQERFAADGWMVIRVTADHARWPRSVVRRVLDALRAGGYGGPDPDFGPLWQSLFS